MKKLFPLLIIVTILICQITSNIFVYPIFSSQANLSSKNMYDINNFNETELYPFDENQISETSQKKAIQDSQNSPEENSATPFPEENPATPFPEENLNKISKISVAKLDWFDTVDSQFKNHTKTRVIDVHSKKTFFVYRDGGQYHAEIEPINKANTEIFFSAYDFEWSWDRRPVWVEIQEDFWACGSINGYPHGNSCNSNTGIDGHICIHFLNSKTHGTKRVCPIHQSCIDYAYKHRDKINEILKDQRSK